MAGQVCLEVTRELYGKDIRIKGSLDVGGGGGKRIKGKISEPFVLGCVLPCCFEIQSNRSRIPKVGRKNAAERMAQREGFPGDGSELTNPFNPTPMGREGETQHARCS